ncbi:MAG: MBL fold metallo-hydrolase [Dehalococcoidales bacterium]|nr:MBL fold metallo-hydrolase [Dehalococcoidales bacterium]
MIIEKLEVGAYAANCYIVSDGTSREGIVIDPGAEAGRILRRVKDMGLNIKAIVLTHGHIDHVGAVQEVKEATGAEVAIHADDAGILQTSSPLSAMLGIPVEMSAPPDRLLEDGDSLTAGKLLLSVIHTPGHTPGGICLLAEQSVFTGDTLFNSSIGRTDLGGGSYDQLIGAIQSKLMTLPDDTAVYPGHGPETTIEAERRLNPFLRG